MRSGFIRLCLLLLSAPTLIVSPNAMAGAGPSVSGKVLLAGPSRPVPLGNAAVRLISPETGKSRTTYTDSQGIFAFYDIPRGKYELQFLLAIKGGKQQKDEKLLEKRSVEVPDTGIRVPDVLVRSTEPDTRSSQEIARLNLLIEGLTLLEREEWGKALKALDEAENIKAKEDPANDWNIYHSRGLANLMVGNSREAKLDFEKAAALQGNKSPKGRAGSLENIAIISLRESNWKEAFRFTGEVNNIYSESSWNWFFRYIAADKLGDKTEAAIARKHWVTLKDRDPPSYMKWLRIVLPKDLQNYLTPG